MSVRVLSDDDQTCLYCSTSMWAFGPIFRSRQEAEDFLAWFQTTPLLDDLKITWIGERHDPRSLTDNQLEIAYSRWLTARPLG